MDEIKKLHRINSLFIPFKYKIKAKIDIFRVFRKIPKNFTLERSKREIYNDLLYKLQTKSIMPIGHIQYKSDCHIS